MVFMVFVPEEPWEVGLGFIIVIDVVTASNQIKCGILVFAIPVTATGGRSLTILILNLEIWHP